MAYQAFKSAYYILLSPQKSLFHPLTSLIQQLQLNAFDVSIVNGDLNSIKSLAEAYLATGDDGVRESPIAFLTALFAKAATSDVKEEVQELFLASQGVIKRMVSKPADLDTLLSTRWPLWGFAYLASLKTAF